MSKHRKSFAVGALAAPSESFKRRNPHLFQPAGGQLPAAVTARSLIAEAKPRERRIRQDQGPKLNKLEAAFLMVLRTRHPDVVIRSQSLRVQIANGAWFKVDHCAFIDGRWVAWEVKGNQGKNIDRGKLALKVAASQWPEIEWWLCWKLNGRWIEQKVLP